MWSQIFKLKSMAFWMGFSFFLQKFLRCILHPTKPTKLVILWNQSDVFRENILVLLVDSKGRINSSTAPPPIYFSCVNLHELDLFSPSFTVIQKSIHLYILLFWLRGLKSASYFFFVRPVWQIFFFFLMVTHFPWALSPHYHMSDVAPNVLYLHFWTVFFI